MSSISVAQLVDGMMCQRCGRPSQPDAGYPGCPCRVWADARRREQRQAEREQRRNERALTTLGPGRAA